MENDQNKLKVTVELEFSDKIELTDIQEIAKNIAVSLAEKSNANSLPPTKAEYYTTKIIVKPEAGKEVNINLKKNN